MPIIFITAQDDPAVRAEAIRAGCVGLLSEDGLWCIDCRPSASRDDGAGRRTSSELALLDLIRLYPQSALNLLPRAASSALSA